VISDSIVPVKILAEFARPVHGGQSRSNSRSRESSFFSTRNLSSQDRFYSLGAAGDEFAIQQFAADEKISAVIEEAISYCWYWANTKAKGDFFDYVRGHDDGRLWSFLLLDSLWNQYQTGSAIERLAQENPPTAEELDNLSDEQVLTRTRRLKNQAR
jgi:hypothetical protein